MTLKEQFEYQLNRFNWYVRSNFAWNHVRNPHHSIVIENSRWLHYGQDDQLTASGSTEESLKLHLAQFHGLEKSIKTLSKMLPPKLIEEKLENLRLDDFDGELTEVARSLWDMHASMVAKYPNHSEFRIVTYHEYDEMSVEIYAKRLETPAETAKRTKKRKRKSKSK